MKCFSAETGRYLSFPCGTPCFHTPQTFCASVSLSLKPEATAQSNPRLSEAHRDQEHTARG